ncbi:MAG: hypothetical protein HC831_18600 [Chloroflexia bacterium]|nr:hypothetical protein [Chloroflexia bacterium]
MRFTFSKISGIELLTKAKRIDIILSATSLKEFEIESFYNAFKASLINFSNYISAPNEKINNLQQRILIRTEYCKAFFSHIENYLCYPDDETRKQVKQLLEIIDKFNHDSRRKCARWKRAFFKPSLEELDWNTKTYC